MIKEISVRDGFIWFDGMSYDEVMEATERLLSGETLIPDVNVRDIDKVLALLKETDGVKIWR